MMGLNRSCKICLPLLIFVYYCILMQTEAYLLPDYSLEMLDDNSGMEYYTSGQSRDGLEFANDAFLEEPRMRLANFGPKQSPVEEEPDEKLVEFVRQLSQAANEIAEAKISSPLNNPIEFLGSSRSFPSPVNNTERINRMISAYVNNALSEIQTPEGDFDPSDAAGDAQSTGQPQSDDSSPPSRYGSGEYIDHPLALIGHQYVQGGAGEGRQLLGPDGSFENVQVVKSDHAVPSYCDPPNPCPIGYSAADGCLEKFVNSASFSREYQASQKCACDNEHSLFNCAAPISSISNDIYLNQYETEPSKSVQSEATEEDQTELSNHIDDLQDERANFNHLDTLARSIQNRFGDLDSVKNLVAKQHESNLNDERLVRVAKKAPELEANFRY